MESKIRFGVRSDDGRTSNVWTCWTQPSKGDAYLTSDVLGKALKLSDHPSGRSHIAFHRERWDLFTPDVRPRERFILKQESAGPAKDVWRIVASVSIPAGSPHDVPREAHVDTIWLPEAAEGQATEISLVRFDVETLAGSWPGKREGTNLIADLPLSGDGHLFVVWRHAMFQMPQAPTTAGKRRPFKGMGEQDLLHANRAVAFGRTASGAFSLIEMPVKVPRNAEG